MRAMEAPLAHFEDLLASQHGLVTLAQLRPRVFAVVGGRDSWERGLLAVVLSIDGAVASHSSAARLWSLEPRPEDRYEITVERKRRTEVRGVAFHSSCTMEDEEVVTETTSRALRSSGLSPIAVRA